MSIEIPSSAIGRAIDSFWHELDPEERQDPEWREWAEEKVSAMLLAALEGWLVPAGKVIGVSHFKGHLCTVVSPPDSQVAYMHDAVFTLRKDKTP